MQILQLDTPLELKEILRDIGVDPYGINIMSQKWLTRLIKLKDISNISANILKQEMLSLGGDVAVSRNSLTGKTKKTDCLLMANDSQLNRLKVKLTNQPFGLGELARQLSQALANYAKDAFSIPLPGITLKLGRQPLLMGVVNLTPDSFSGDGMSALPLDEIIRRVENMEACGAQIIDIGGESSRPGAKPISVKEELARIQPALKILVKKIRLPISVDTYKPEVADRALACGAHIINDITALRSPGMAKIISRHKAGVVLMHMQGTPLHMQRHPEYVSVVDEIILFFERAIEKAIAAGIDKNRIIIDPGIGFGKALKHNLQILKHLKRFKILGLPILLGVSRKSFIGKLSHTQPQERIFGTTAACILAVENGACILRVHDVKEVKEAFKITEGIGNA